METKDLLLDLAWTWGVEINNLNHKVKLVDAVGKESIYFVCGFDKNSKERVWDDDFTKKKYIFVDIDIRSRIHALENRIITDDELENYVFEVFWMLEKAKLADFRYSCLSGNWLHLYYVWEEQEIGKKEYTQAVRELHRRIDLAIHPLLCDKACTNIARISRLPWTINNRQKKWWLEPRVCTMITNSTMVADCIQNIHQYASDYAEFEKREKENQQYIRSLSTSYKKDDEIFEKINQIPAREIAEKVWAVKYQDCDKDSCPLLEESKNMGAYYYKPKNLVVNTGSSLIRNKGEKYRTTYRLARDEMFWGDVKKTIEFFKSKYDIQTGNTQIVPDKQYFSKAWYVYWTNVFDAFECIMSGELWFLVAETNAWKTTFAMNMLQSNKNIGKKSLYINLEFDIANVARTRRLTINGKTKRNMTDLAPLTEEEQASMDRFVAWYLSQFEYYNNPAWLSIEELIDIMLKKLEENIGLFVVDSFSALHWLHNDASATINQSTAVKKLQEFVQKTGACILMLHHTNKTWVFEGSQKIKDLANVFIQISKDEDARGNKKTKFTLSKDKFVSKIELLTDFVAGEYVLSP